MQNIISLRNISFSYPQKEVFSNFSFELPQDNNVTIMDNSASGKTTFLKILSKDLIPKGQIFVGYIDETKPNSPFISKNIDVIFDDTTFLKETIKEELLFVLENSLINPKDISKKLEQFSAYFEINRRLNTPIIFLDLEERYYLKIITHLITLPNLVAFDDVLSKLNNKHKNKIFSFLKDYNIQFINVTSNIEEALKADYLLILKDGKIAIEGSTLSVLKEEKLLHRLNYALPFIVDLSIQLIHYDVIDKIYLDKESLVEAIWK